MALGMRTCPEFNRKPVQEGDIDTLCCKELHQNYNSRYAKECQGCQAPIQPRLQSASDILVFALLVLADAPGKIYMTSFSGFSAQAAAKFDQVALCALQSPHSS